MKAQTLSVPAEIQRAVSGTLNFREVSFSTHMSSKKTAFKETVVEKDGV